jgi:heavy metal translocating P-type ATPase
VSESRSERPHCRFCETPLSTDDDDPFCSRGCREVADALGSPKTPTDAAGLTADGKPRSDAPTTDPVPPGIETTFFRVDGMHSALCEAYLEAVADRRDGVVEASASYVTESVRVAYNPATTSADELLDALSPLGYTAYHREGSDVDDDTDGGTHRDREISGMRRQRVEDLLEVRYIIGVVFGSFLLVPYITVFYPVHLASLIEWSLGAQYASAFETFDGLLILPLFLTVTGIVLYLTGMPLLRGAYVSLRLRRANAHLLAALTIVVAYGYGTLAFVLGRVDIYYDLTIVVAATVMAAVFFESTIKRGALARLTELTASQVGAARRLEPDGTTAEVPVEELCDDDRVLVRQGERVPVDGVLAEGECAIDEAVVTGESLPVSKRPGDEVIGGSVVAGGAAVVEPRTALRRSIDRLTETVWDLQSATHGVQRRADRLAGRLLPLVVGAALTVGAVRYGLGAGASDAVQAALLTLLVASPWAIALAAPVSVATSVRDAMERGIIVFDESVFERLRGVDVVVFDKTGTLTTGEMCVLDADASSDLLRAASALERRATHPAATAIAAAFETPGDWRFSGSRSLSDARSDGGVSTEGTATVEAFESHATGVEGLVDGRRVLVGHPDLFEERGCALDAELEGRVVEARERGRLPVVVGREGRETGLVVVGDEARTGWTETASRLGEAGLDVVVLTGDHPAAAEFLDAHPAVSHVFPDVSPTGKTATIRRLAADRQVAMVGDGTNDAPALAAADIGISLGGGTALAADAADLAILDDEIGAVERAFALSSTADDRVTQNLALAFVYNAVAIPAALLGLLTPLTAMVGLFLTVALVVGNASRPLLDRD